jgi:hypothetical protein
VFFRFFPKKNGKKPPGLHKELCDRQTGFAA